MGEKAAYEPTRGGVTPADVRVRPAQMQDARAIALLSARREGLDEDAVFERCAAELEGLERGDPGLMLVAEVDGRVVGFGRARPLAASESPSELDVPAGWYLLGVIVDPAQRRRGVGRALVQGRLDALTGRTACAYTFINRANRASRDLLEGAGFRVLERPFRYERSGLEPGDGWLLRCDLPRPAAAAD